jgi:hypothetical protein
MRCAVASKIGRASVFAWDDFPIVVSSPISPAPSVPRVGKGFAPTMVFCAKRGDALAGDVHAEARLRRVFHPRSDRRL